MKNITAKKYHLILVTVLCWLAISSEKVGQSSWAVEPPNNSFSLEECKRVVNVTGKLDDILICSAGDHFSIKGGLKYKGDRIKIIRKTGAKLTLIRDLDVLTTTPVQFAVKIIVESNKKPTSVEIIVTSEEYPHWKTVPLFKEQIDLLSNRTKIHVLKKVHRFDATDAERRFKEISVPVDNLDFLYKNLFVLRDYGFSQPELIEGYLRKLQSADWIDGEVAEVLGDLLAQISYVKGKSIGKKVIK